jgi:excisionase family DNA binding protein
MMTTATQWLSVKEAAEYLGVKESTLYAWINQRRIPFHKIPGSHLVRFKVSDLIEWLESGKVETVDEALSQE